MPSTKPARRPKKERTEIPRGVAARIQFLSDRTCCVCRTPDKPIQIHHLDEKPSNHTEENLALLCLDCHDKTMIRGGFGRKLARSPDKLTAHPGVIILVRSLGYQTECGQR